MPAPRLLLAIPVLPALSVEESLHFFEFRLGFNRHIDSETYGGVERDGLQIHFWLCTDPELPKRSSCRLNVAGVDALYERWMREGVVPEGEGPREQPWGFREISVVDPSGNRIVFAEEIPGWVKE